MCAKPFDIEELADACRHKSPVDILSLAFEHFEDIAISFSGAEDVVLVDMAVKIKPDVRIFSIDTGRLHSETYRFIERVRTHYNVEIDLLFPDAEQLARLVREKGLFSFYKDGHQECCGLRKVAPLRRLLASLDAWITGQRRSQSPDTRQMVPALQQDRIFSSGERELVKFNPLYQWDTTQVWDYISEHEVPYNELHKKGFISIGCEPCTRAVLPGQHERQARWWWERSDEKECGLHADNLNQTPTDN